MNFIIVDTLTVCRTVKVTVPSNIERDAFVEQSFVGVFRVLPTDEVRRIDEDFLALEPEERVVHEHDFLRKILVGWQDVMDATGEPVPFSEDVLGQALRWPWFAPGVYAAYREMMQGDKVRLGN